MYLSDQVEIAAVCQPEQLQDNWGILWFSIILGRYIPLAYILPLILYQKYVPQMHFKSKSVFLAPKKLWLTVIVMVNNYNRNKQEQCLYSFRLYYTVY